MAVAGAASASCGVAQHEDRSSLGEFCCGIAFASYSEGGGTAGHVLTSRTSVHLTEIGCVQLSAKLISFHYIHLFIDTGGLLLS